MPKQAESLIGQQFGTRRVVGQGTSRYYAGYKTIYWKTVCTKCGHETEVQGGSLKRGAGCQRCLHGAAPIEEPQSKLKAPTVETLAKNRPMTVGQLMATLGTLPMKSQLRVHLVGHNGHATRMLKDVSSVSGYVLLVAELPTRIDPWRG